MAAAVVELLDDEPARQMLGERARRCAERFSIDAAADALMRQYALAMES
jgi:glycosyltransferase involved in cell wall biosynthesis